MFTGTIDKMVGWKCKALSEESITTPATPGYELAPRLNYINNAKIQEKIDGSCLKQARLSYTRGSNKLFYCFWIRYMVIWFIWSLKYCLFGAVKLTKNANSDKPEYSYSE